LFVGLGIREKASHVDITTTFQTNHSHVISWDHPAACGSAGAATV